MADASTAIVMAAGQGLGAGIARHLHSVGYRLVLLSNDEGAEALASELGCIGTQGSVTSVEDIDRTVQIAVDSFGRIDLVVNNTGHAATGEVGATVAFLASAGGAYITGQNLRVDGGLARPI